MLCVSKINILVNPSVSVWYGTNIIGVHVSLTETIIELCNFMIIGNS